MDRGFDPALGGEGAGSGRGWRAEEVEIDYSRILRFTCGWKSACRDRTAESYPETLHYPRQRDGTRVLEARGSQRSARFAAHDPTWKRDPWKKRTCLCLIARGSTRSRRSRTRSIFLISSSNKQGGTNCRDRVDTTATILRVWKRTFVSSRDELPLGIFHFFSLSFSPLSPPSPPRLPLPLRGSLKAPRLPRFVRLSLFRFLSFETKL